MTSCQQKKSCVRQLYFSINPARMLFPVQNVSAFLVLQGNVQPTLFVNDCLPPLPALVRHATPRAASRRLCPRRERPRDPRSRHGLTRNGDMPAATNGRTVRLRRAPPPVTSRAGQATGNALVNMVRLVVSLKRRDGSQPCAASDVCARRGVQGMNACEHPVRSFSSPEASDRGSTTVGTILLLAQDCDNHGEI